MTTSRPHTDSPPPSPGQRRPRARRGEGSLLRDELLDAAERLLLATGSAEAVSIRSVADAVGVTPPSIYRHFADKEALIAEVCARHFRTLADEIDAAVDGLTDPVEELTARGRAYVRFGIAHPEPYRILFMTRLVTVPEKTQRAWLAGSEVFGGVVANVQACIDAGRLRPELTDAYEVALGLWARVHGVTSLAVIKPFLGLAEEPRVDPYVEQCLQGIVADDGRTPEA